MITVYEGGGALAAGAAVITRRTLGPDEPIPAGAVWLDLFQPTADEDHKVEGFLGISVPTREDMQDIEPSELLYVENGSRYMTTRLLVRSDTDEACLSGVTFVLTSRLLVTVRYESPRAFEMFAARVCGSYGTATTAEQMLRGLVEATIDRAADVLQALAERLDRLSRSVFEPRPDPASRNAEYQGILRSLGNYGDVISKQRESLVSIERTLLFVSASLRGASTAADFRADVREMLRDLQSLEEHATFQSSKIQFLLDATLGLVNLEQNNIIKLFSVMAVVFMPPTLIASIYGMNFKHMPELDFTFGYPMALIMMVVAAIAPYFLFRWKGWL